MSVKVKIPTQLRSLTEGADEVEAKGTTLSDVLEDLENRHPRLPGKVGHSGAVQTGCLGVPIVLGSESDAVEARRGCRSNPVGVRHRRSQRV